MVMEVRNRKRPAPGTSPMAKPEMQTPNSPAPFTWQGQDTTNGAYADPYLGNQSDLNSQLQPVQQNLQAQNQLARRTNQNIVPIQNYPNSGNGSWQVAEPAQDVNTGQADDLDQRAVVAKKEAESKRKQIPPFVQKLSSFLDESRNNDLIRWSDSGDSFIVVDEDEFARVMIPEMFKHNNYASFVRQLNMYGFHKKVGLSDNSMRASERKNKNPSEYSNPYFKRGRPNLLWLIQKPKNSNAKSGQKGNYKSKHEDYDEEIDETFGREHSPFVGNLDNFDDVRGGRQNLLTMGNSQPAGVPQDQLANVQRELTSIRENQHRISNMLKEVRREHQQLYGQAKAFHDLHEKHDNSINAILTFLATVYSKNLDGQQGGLGEMFPGAIPTNDQNRGNVVDMGDVREHSVESSTPRPYRKPPLLLEDGKRSQVPSTNTMDKKDAMRDYKNQMLNYNSNAAPKKDLEVHSPAVQELSDHSAQSSPRPDQLDNDNQNINNQQQHQQQQQQIPNADIMSMLTNASSNNNAFSPNTMDFSEALSHLQNSSGNTPLTPGQRQNMLQLMGDEYNSPNSNALAQYPAATTPGAGNGLVSQAQFDQTSDNLDTLGEIIKNQGQNINNLSNTLTPLSPSGSIPGIDDTGGPGDYSLPLDQNLEDLDNFFNTESYFGNTNTNPGGDGTGDGGLDFGEGIPDFNFGDDVNGADAGFGTSNNFGEDADTGGQLGVNDEESRVKETDSSVATSPDTVNTVATVEDDDDGLPSPGKKRRVG